MFFIRSYGTVLISSAYSGWSPYVAHHTLLSPMWLKLQIILNFRSLYSFNSFSIVISDPTLNNRRTAPIDIHSSNRTQNLPRKYIDTRNTDSYKSPNYNFKRNNRSYGNTNNNRNDHKNNTQQQHFKYNTNYNEHTPHTNYRNKWHNKKSRNQNLQKYKKTQNQNEQSFGDRRLEDARRFSRFRQERHEIDENNEPQMNFEHEEDLVDLNEPDMITFL